MWFIRPLWRKCELLSRVWLFATPRTIFHQAPLSMGFSGQEHWSRLPFPSPWDLPDPGIEPVSPEWQEDSSPAEPSGKSHFISHERRVNSIDGWENRITGHVQIRTTMRKHYVFILQWLKFKSLIKSSKEVKELETSYTDGRSIKWDSHFEKQTSNIWFSHSTCRYLTKRKESTCLYEDLSIRFKAALSANPKSRNNQNIPQQVNLTTKLWYIHAVWN